MFIFSEKEKLRYAVVNVYKNGVYGFPCADREEAAWRASHMTGLAYRIVVKPIRLVPRLSKRPEGA